MRGREGRPGSHSGGDTGNKHRQRPWCGCNEKRESYEKTLKEEKTRPGNITGGGGVGRAEAHGDSALDLQSPREFFFLFFFFLKFKFGKAEVLK